MPSAHRWVDRFLISARERWSPGSKPNTKPKVPRLRVSAVEKRTENSEDLASSKGCRNRAITPRLSNMLRDPQVVRLPCVFGRLVNGSW